MNIETGKINEEMAIASNSYYLYKTIVLNLRTIYFFFHTLIIVEEN